MDERKKLDGRWRQGEMTGLDRQFVGMVTSREVEQICGGDVFLGSNFITESECSGHTMPLLVMATFDSSVANSVAVTKTQPTTFGSP